MNKKTKILALALTLSTSLSLCSFTAGAAAKKDESGEKEKTSLSSLTRNELTVLKVRDKNVYSYKGLALSFNGKTLKSDLRLINGIPYVSLRSFINETTNMSVTYYSQRKTLNVKGTGFEMDAIDGSNVLYANGRTLFSASPSTIMSNGRMYTPLSLVSKALGFSYNYSSEKIGVTLSGSVKPILSGNLYYREDEVYWLSRIISAESRGESLLGQIAVGNVVLNRVKSQLYPNTIWSVIFDRKYGVQFSPIIDGSIYNTPVASAVTAAKICLEYYFEVSESALFFLYPKNSTSSWIPNNRTYLFTIGKHDFYA